LSLRAYAQALLSEARPDFSWKRIVDTKRETMSGVTGAVLVIPQAITFAYLVGLPPEYGLYCAVFVGFFASLLGNTPMVGGPNTAMSILLALTIMPFAGRGSPLYIDYVLLLSVVVGLIQLLIWLLRGAELFRYFSPAAISGIKMGVGVLLITSAVEGTLGLAPLTTQFFYEKFYIAIVSWGEIVNPHAATVSGLTIATGLLLRKRLPMSYIIVAVVTGGVAGAVLIGIFGMVRADIELLGRIPFQLLPLRVPTVSAEYLLVMQEVFPAAVAIAVLGLAQSLVIAQDLKSHVKTQVSLGREVFAQGVANLAGPFVSSFAGSGSFNRTSVAISMGAMTPLSGMIAAVAVAAIAWSLGPLLNWLSMPAVAGVLALVGIGMIHVGEARRLLHSSIDGPVFVITILTVTFLGLKAGLAVAVLLSLGFFIAGVSKVALVMVDQDGVERIQVTGNLFYASLDALAQHLREHPGANSLLDLTRVPYCDSSALAMIEAIKRERLAHGGRLEVVTAD
jgi:sulfate permease, SulP family